MAQRQRQCWWRTKRKATDDQYGDHHHARNYRDDLHQALNQTRNACTEDGSVKYPDARSGSRPKRSAPIASRFEELDEQRPHPAQAPAAPPIPRAADRLAALALRMAAVRRLRNTIQSTRRRLCNRRTATCSSYRRNGPPTENSFRTLWQNAQLRRPPVWRLPLHSAQSHQGEGRIAAADQREYRQRKTERTYSNLPIGLDPRRVTAVLAARGTPITTTGGTNIVEDAAVRNTQHVERASR